MTPRRAAKVDANQGQIVETLRASGAVVWPTHRVGDGFPDLLVFVPWSGKLCLLEVKNGARAKLTADEKKFFREFAGAPVYIVRNVDEALAKCGIEAYTWNGEGLA